MTDSREQFLKFRVSGQSFGVIADCILSSSALSHIQKIQVKKVLAANLVL